jgi:molecular chaperone GrpE
MLNENSEPDGAIVELSIKNDPKERMVAWLPEEQVQEEKDESAPAVALSAEQHALLQRFSSFLMEERLEPLSAPDSVDLFTLFREMAELKNEVKLESRQIKKALDDYKELIGLLKSNNELLSQQLTLQNDLQARSREQQRKEYALELIGFCDYLILSLENMKLSRKTGWLSKRFKSAQFINQVAEGQGLLLARFRAILKGLDVKPMTVIDKPFDPSIMCVGEICTKADRPNAVVVSEIQTGYFIGQNILRLADVVVNKLNEEKVR